MKMGVVAAIVYIHMLLWAGCNATLSAHSLGSDEILLSKAQPIKVFLRKLLQEENMSKIEAETANASGRAEPTSVDGQDANADVKEEEDVVLNAKLDEPKTDSASSTAQQEEAKGESAAATMPNQNDATKKEEPKEALKEEVSSVATDNDSHIREMKEVEIAENLTSKAIAQSQPARGEDKSTPSTDAGDAKVSEKPVETERKVKEEGSGQTDEKEEASGERTDVKENKNVLNVDTQEKLLEGGVKEGAAAVVVAEEDKGDNTPKQEDVTPGDAKASGGETPIEESGGVVNSTETATEVNLIKMVETDSDGKHTDSNLIKMVETDNDGKHTDLNNDTKIEIVQSHEPDHGDKEQISLDAPLAIIKEQDSSNSTDGDTKVDGEKVEKQHDDNTEITEKKGEKTDASEEASQVKSEETGVEKLEVSDSNMELKDKESENKDTEEVLQEKSEETGEETLKVSDSNMELKDKESENKDTEEVLQEKAEEHHEANEEKVEENQESSEENTEVKDKEGDDDDTEVSQVKPDDETQAVVKEVETQLEELKRDAVFDTINDQRQERDPSDDEYDIIQEIADLPTKFQETAEKVADHLRPEVLRWSDTSKEYFNLANQQISESFSPLIGRQYAPFFASMISYGILLLPLIVVVLLFDHIKALFSLQKVLLFINIYLAAYFATLWLASFIIGLEPMSFFYQNSLSSYLSLQLLQALGYVVYLILQTANMISSCTSDTRTGKVTSSLQWMVALGIGLHYYVTVFHPAVASKPPHTNWKFYAIYTAAFFILCLFARIRWVKKQYVSIGNDMANKKS